MDLEHESSVAIRMEECLDRVSRQKENWREKDMSITQGYKTIQIVSDEVQTAIGKSRPDQKGAQSDWVQKQVKVVKAWINDRLKLEENNRVTDLSKDLSDGKILLQLLETMTNKKLVQTKWKGGAQPHAFKAIYSMENVNIALSNMVELGIISKYSQVGTKDITSGNLKMILAVMWGIIRYVEEGPEPKNNTLSETEVDSEQKIEKENNKSEETVPNQVVENSEENETSESDSEDEENQQYLPTDSNKDIQDSTSARNSLTEEINEETTDIKQDSRNLPEYPRKNKKQGEKSEEEGIVFTKPVTDEELMMLQEELKANSSFIFVMDNEISEDSSDEESGVQNAVSGTQKNQLTNKKEEKRKEKQKKKIPKKELKQKQKEEKKRKKQEREIQRQEKTKGITLRGGRSEPLSNKLDPRHRSNSEAQLGTRQKIMNWFFKSSKKSEDESSSRRKSRELEKKPVEVSAGQKPYSRDRSSTTSENFQEPTSLPKINESIARDLVVKEIFTSEIVYFRHLDKLVNTYLPNLEEMITPEEKKTLFSNITVLRNFSLKFLQELLRKLEDWSPSQVIGDIFLKFYPFFKSYNQYCNNYDSAIECYVSCMKRQDFSDYCKEELSRTPNGLGPDLQSLLIQPVQRIPRYMLLLKELLSKTPKEHPDYSNLEKGVEKIMEITEVVNNSIKQTEKSKLYNKVVDSVEGIKAYMAPHRKFLFEAKFSISIVSKSNEYEKRWMIFFSDMGFVASGPSYEKRVLDCHFPLHAVWCLKSNVPSTYEVVTPEYILVAKVLDEEQSAIWKDILDLFPKEEETRTFEFTFASGLNYNGTWKLGKMHGMGVGSFPDGKKYTGEWVNGEIDGNGTIVYSDKASYEGQWKAGLPHGKGKHVQAGVVYTGSVKNGMKQGKGILRWDNGDQYFGKFKADCIHGEGTLICANGDKYVGGWKNNMKNGKGTLLTQVGKYEGDWVDDMKEGDGIFIYSNGCKYIGKWKSNQRHGNGVYLFPGGMYDGEWMNDFKDGKGTLIYYGKNDDKNNYFMKYEGDFKKDQKHGYGVLTRQDGYIYKGNWEKDKREGKGISIDSTGTYTGYWRENQRHGLGTFISTNSKIKYKGTWINGTIEGEGELVTEKNNELFIDPLYNHRYKNSISNLGDSPLELPSIKLLDPFK